MTPETLVIKVDSLNPEREVISRAAEVIRAGGLVAFPTETVYGLGADALNPRAVKKIFIAKGRPLDNPIIVHIADLGQMKVLADSVSAMAVALAERLWPGWRLAQVRRPAPGRCGGPAHGYPPLQRPDRRAGPGRRGH